MTNPFLELKALGQRVWQRAIELSTTRYCPVIGMLGKVAEVATRYEIELGK
jgi:uncharacterized OsmC-like protein